jgi:hypothetical protein
MEIIKSNLTKHARERMTTRNIPIDIFDDLESFGELRKCRDGGYKLAFSKSSRSQIRKERGKTALKELEKYKTLYAVMCNNKIVTVARSRTPLFSN